MQRILVEMVFGSHLYGTDTPESDKDYKGVFMPTLRDVLLQRVSDSISQTTGNDRSKNTAEDVDRELYSLNYFVEMAAQGQTAALDMLHAPDDMILQSSCVWETLVANRDKFYTKDMTAFVGYCRKQASKYGIKGSRISDARRVRDFCLSMHPSTKLKEVWSILPKGEYINFLPPNPRDQSKQQVYQVIGKRFLENSRVTDVAQSLGKFLAEVGARALKAERNEGIDWKAMSHALRAAEQVRQILVEGTIVFPLHNAKFLKQVKAGELGYSSIVAPELERRMDEIEHLASISTLPDSVDRDWCDQLVAECLVGEYNGKCYENI